jgi:serine phosphatase RsbU (regulator of sigma subunit)
MACPMVLPAQNHEIDSLSVVLKTEKDDTNKVNTLNQLSEDLWGIGQYDTSKAYSNRAIELGQKLSYLKGQCKSYRNLGIISSLTGNYPEALAYYFKGLPLAEQIGDKRGAASFLGNIGIIYDEQGNYAQAIVCYQKGLVLYKEIDYKKGISGILSCIGVVYKEQKNYKPALVYDSNALAIDIAIDNKRGIERNYTNIGLIYSDLGNTPKALEFSFKALAISREIGNRNGEAISLENIGSEYLDEKKYALTKTYNDSALALANSIGSKEVIRDCYGNKAAVDSAMGKMKEAFEDFKYYIAYRDSMKNEENTKKLVSEQMQYDFDKKQAETKAEQDKKDAIDAADKRKQQIVTASVGLGLFLVLIFSGLLFNRFRITQRQKVIIERQKALVEEKNKEMHDSITYAKRLQDAILPSLSTIKKHLPESFVLYKPKDIVAGDFYWMEQTESALFIAAADCTGHGVPGAMVSVVCSNALNRAMKEFKITEPGKILDKTRELVLETFEKSESNVQDGMDISLIAISRKSLVDSVEIQWSGAFNSLWYVQNGEMKELAADKQPIGKTDNPKPFTTHIIKEGAMLYLFTDGYADQFGGPKGKKFKYKTLQQLIMDNAQLAMDEQKNILNETIENWRGTLEQVDDVLIIGIRV